MADELVAAARRWAAADPDPVTKEELASLIAAGATEELADRMAGPLQFGTAGLRGEVAAGPNRMNRAVVIRATRGVADWLLGRDRRGPVVVGFDARPSSQQFAADTVAVLAAAGIPVMRFSDVVPTPLVAYQARVAKAAAAIVITASHNPPADNGYKVYADNAAQIVPPTDAAIAAAIAAVGPAVEIPRSEHGGELVTELAAEQVFDRYWAEVDAVRPGRGRRPSRRPLPVVYTPLHGVGGRFTVAALERAGHGPVHPVPEQFQPDGRFPTVSFPNPEEPGALDLAIRLADDRGAELILANDPDADRLAVAVPSAAGWQALTGNQIGILLADYVLAGTDVPTPLVVSSIVSTPMIEAVATAHGAVTERTLTGFKWICTAALAMEEAGDVRFVFGFEEALGYTVGGVVRDKDGIGAAVAFVDMASALIDEGSSVAGQLASLYRRHGLWVSRQESVVLAGPEGAAAIAAAMDRLPGELPQRLGPMEVHGAVDYREDAALRPPWLGATPLVALDLGGGSRALVRPSGTEPKLKVYVDLRLEVTDRIPLPDQERRGEDTAGDIAGDLLGFLDLG